ncbi:MAG: hypothetical protein KatS3mg105_2209 [Gemmatales bacterium]|nr:MAG: hypothetical protein KatS3mg105_2209 [Gemmatales bacterium]
MSGRSGHNLKLDTLDRDHPRFLSRLQDVVNLAHPAARPTRDESRKFGEMLDSLVPKIVATTRGLRVQIDEPPEHWMGPAFLPGELLIGEPVGTRDEILFNVARLFLPGRTT